jgi:hypothetical protein
MVNMLESRFGEESGIGTGGLNGPAPEWQVDPLVANLPGVDGRLDKDRRSLD